ncbi:M20/M25/M40 family metallo-hydrolase [Paenibacillus sp. IITD108]|uniref:M20/M25/M40 family metallo-hydrolase n=1 Tax=Paenibacillus sp. IITD108 TaxID=3116649 RepID=UPI002F3EC0E1
MPKLETVIGLKTKHPGKAWYSLVLLLVFILLSVYMDWPPKPQSEITVGTEFSAERAFQHLEVIAQKPHPTGSLENEKVRQYLVDQLKILGLDPQVEQRSHLDVRYDFVNSVEVYNVVGSIKGSDGGKKVVLMAHYDSVPTGPGANDNGVAVAALLETARILKTAPQPKNDILFVFTDAEEMGLIGAKEYWADPARIGNTGIVINLEARGSKGSSLMFQTSRHNEWLIQEFGKVAPNPVTSSLLSSFYEKMPNDTDLTIAIEAGLPSLNFAYGQGWTAYHSTMDNIESVHLGTLQHHGENALQLARHFGQIDFNDLAATSNRVFFSFLGQVVHYPEGLAVPIAIFLFALYLTVLIGAFRKKVISFAQIGTGFLAIFTSIAGSLLVILPLWFLVNKLWAHKMSLLDGGGLHDGMLYNLSFLLITVGLCLFVWNCFKRKLNRFAVVLSAMLLWLIILVLLTLYLKGATYLFAFPLLINLVVLGVSLFRPEPDKMIRHPIALAVVCFVPVILFTSVFQLLYSFLPVDLNVFINVIAVLLLAFLYVPVGEIGHASRWTPIVPTGIAVVLLIISWALAAPTEQRQVNSNLFYVLDDETQEAQWVTMFPPNEWTKQYVDEGSQSGLENILSGAGYSPVWTGIGPVVPVNSPEINIIEKSTNNGEQNIQLKIKTEEHTRVLYLTLTNPSPSTSVQLGDRIIPMALENESLTIRQTGLPQEGLTLHIKGPASEALELQLTEVRDQVVEKLARVWQERPNELAPGGRFDGNMLIKSHFKIDQMD